MITRGDICWVDLSGPGEADHRPAGRRPALVVQSDAYNQSKLGTVVVMALTSNLAAAGKPGNVMLVAGETGLPKDSVANVTQVVTLNRFDLEQPPAGHVPLHLMQQVDRGLATALGLTAP